MTHSGDYFQTPLSYSASDRRCIKRLTVRKTDGCDAAESSRDKAEHRLAFNTSQMMSPNFLSGHASPKNSETSQRDITAFNALERTQRPSNGHL